MERHEQIALYDACRDTATHLIGLVLEQCNLAAANGDGAREANCGRGRRADVFLSLAACSRFRSFQVVTAATSRRPLWRNCTASKISKAMAPDNESNTPPEYSPPMTAIASAA